jgi:hypothetical protein
MEASRAAEGTAHWSQPAVTTGIIAAAPGFPPQLLALDELAEVLFGPLIVLRHHTTCRRPVLFLLGHVLPRTMAVVLLFWPFRFSRATADEDSLAGRPRLRRRLHGIDRNWKSKNKQVAIRPNYCEVCANLLAFHQHVLPASGRIEPRLSAVRQTLLPCALPGTGTQLGSEPISCQRRFLAKEINLNHFGQLPLPALGVLVRLFLLASSLLSRSRRP